MATTPTHPLVDTLIDAAERRAAAARDTHQAIRELAAQLDTATARRLGLPAALTMSADAANSAGLAADVTIPHNPDGPPRQLRVESIMYGMGHNEVTTRNVHTIDIADIVAALDETS